MDLDDAMETRGAESTELVGGLSAANLGFASPSTRQDSNLLRTFCRYCQSQPFFCGDLLELCYARNRFRLLNI